MIGRLVGQFRVEREVGRGGMGVVYEAVHSQIGQRVAIKLLSKELADSPIAVQRFFDEARAVAMVQHESLVKVFDFGQLADGPLYLLMEYLDGESVRTRLDRLMRLPVSVAIRVARQIASALEAVHLKNIVHRDLKPENAMLIRDAEAPGGERVKVLDFGLVKFRRPDIAQAATFDQSLEHREPPAPAPQPMRYATGPGRILGTPLYMAPEQLAGAATVDQKADVYSLAVMLYEMLAGDLPFDVASDDPRAIPRLNLGSAKPSLRDACPSIDADLEALVPEMLRPEPATRPSMTEVLGRLRRLDREAEPSAPTTRQKAISSPEFWTQTSPGPQQNGRADDVVSRRRAGGVSVVVIHTGGPEWDALVPAVLAAAGMEIEPVIVSCPPPGADLGAAAQSLRETLIELVRSAPELLFVTDAPGGAIIGRLLADEYGRFSEPPGATARPPNYRRSIAVRTRHIVTVVLSAADAASAATASRDLEAVWDHRLPLAPAALPKPALEVLTVTDLSSERTASAVAKAMNPKRYLDRAARLVASESVVRSLELDGLAQIRTLIAPVEEDTGVPEAPATIDYSSPGTQLEIHDLLLAMIRSTTNPAYRIVVTGSAGVGKSTVLRILARTLAVERLRTGHTDDPLPVLVPLPQEKLTPNELKAIMELAGVERGRLLLHTVLQRWCAWANRLLATDDVVTFAWLCQFMGARSTVLMLDGVDEFLTNNAGIRIQDVREAMRVAATDSAGNPELFIIAGLRSSQPGLRSLASSAGHVLEVIPMTVAQARQRFPAIVDVLDDIKDPGAYQLFLTPLVLAWLGPRARRLTGRSLKTRTAVIEQALTAIVEESHLTDLVTLDGAATDTESVLNALTVLGWIFFAGFRGDASIDELCVEARQIAARWDAIAGTDDGEASAHLLPGYRLAGDEPKSMTLLQRTVFFPTGYRRVRFTHREWQDFLASRYLAQCISSGHLSELRHIGYTPRMFRTAGDLLIDMGFQVDEPMVRNILETGRQPGSSLVTANFSALMTSSRVPMDGPAIDLLLSSLASMPPLAKLVAVNGLGYRALRDDDSSAKDLRVRLTKVFQSYLTPGSHSPPVGAIVASTAWCYLMAYARCFNSPRPQCSMPDLDSPSAHEEAIGMVCARDPGGLRVLPAQRSAQLAFLELQSIVLEDSCRPISGAHYLYTLVVARLHGGHIAEVGRELPGILDPTSPNSRIMDNYNVVPELATIMSLCRRIDAET